jgi:hypothetical protein
LPAQFHSDISIWDGGSNQRFYAEVQSLNERGVALAEQVNPSTLKPKPKDKIRAKQKV